MLPLGVWPQVRGCFNWNRAPMERPTVSGRPNGRRAAERERESSVTLGEVCATGRAGMRLEEQDERQEWGHEEENGGRK